ncbi:MAG: hypothetical protein AB1416_13250 [Actinomycetota bacterium]
MGRRRQAGQASVEAVGLAVAVALLLASLTMWAARAWRAPDAPPVGLDSLTDLVRNDPLPGGLPPVLAAHHGFSGLRGGGDAPIGRALRVARDVVRIGAPALAEGAWDRLRERAASVVRNPVETMREALRGIGEAGTTNPVDAVRRRIGAFIAYVGSLRGLSRDEIVRRVSYDLGGVLADAAVSRVLRVAAGRIVRGRPAPAESPGG